MSFIRVYAHRPPILNEKSCYAWGGGHASETIICIRYLDKFVYQILRCALPGHVLVCVVDGIIIPLAHFFFLAR